MSADDTHAAIASNDVVELISMTKKELLNISDLLRVNKLSANAKSRMYGNQLRSDSFWQGVASTFLAIPSTRTKLLIGHCITEAGNMVETTKLANFIKQYTFLYKETIILPEPQFS